MRSFFRILVVLILLCPAAPAWAFSVNDIRFGTHPDKTRMVIELSEVKPFRAYTMANPSRLVIDMPAFDWRVGNISPAQGAAVKSVRQGILQPGISRIAIDLKNTVVIEAAFILPRDPAANKPDRLVIDFARSTSGAAQGEVFGKLQIPGGTNNRQAAMPLPVMQEPVTTASVASSIDDNPVPGRKPANDSPLRVPSAEKPVIVIDAGHGGVDPGALGANGVFEKQVTLSMAKALKEELEKTGRYKVLLTREKDSYLKLFKRVEFARMNHADLFISLHADSIGKSNVRGASIYTLSEKASDEQTALLADRENRADLIAGMDLDTNDEQVATILVDLTMRDTMNQSKFFANKLVGNMAGGSINMLENPHRYAGFAVLKAPDIPSVLIEMGFMSNPREAEQLNKPEYRRNMARSLVQGIDAYFAKLALMQRT